MKFLVIFTVCLVAIVVARPEDASTAKPEEKYTDKFDNINIDQILNNKRLLDNYAKCLLEEGRCTSEGAELKKVLPDALETKCSKCSEKQKTGAEKIIRHLAQKEKELWNKLMDKYDPEKKWRKEYEDEAKARGIEIPMGETKS